MTFIDILLDYVVPVVAGIFFLIFASVFIYIIHRALLKPLGIYGMIKSALISLRRKKLLKDEKILEYCVVRAQNNWDEPKVREELLLANKYNKKRIDEIVYVFNSVKKEMDLGKIKVAEDLP